MPNSFTWHGDQLSREMEAKLVRGFVKWGLSCETAARTRLRPSEQDAEGDWVPGGGHGKRTGHLQRSIHIAAPGYNWAGDNGAQGDLHKEAVQPKRGNGRLTLEIGSGVEYALLIHQTHYDPEVYHFITAAIAEKRSQLTGTLQVEMRNAP